MSYGQNAGPTSLTFLLDSSPRTSRGLRDSLAADFTFPNPPPPPPPQPPQRSVRDSIATGRSEYTEFELTDTESLAAPSEYTASSSEHHHQHRGLRQSVSSSFISSDYSSLRKGSFSSSIYSAASSTAPAAPLRRPIFESSTGPAAPLRPVFESSSSSSTTTAPPPPPLPIGAAASNGKGDIHRRGPLSKIVTADEERDQPLKAHQLDTLNYGKTRPNINIHTEAAAAAASSSSSPYMKTFLEQKTPTSATFPQPPSNNIPRSTASPADAELKGAVEVTPASKLPMDHQVEDKNLKRDVSMDSVTSSLSSNVSPSQTSAAATPSSLSQMSPQDDAKDSLHDVGKLIASAGSAEAAIQKLLKEKNAAVTRSNQLWKLVEQQREMILTLNRDLKRLLKERDPSKRKLDGLPASPGMPPTPTQELYAGDTRTSGSSKKKHTAAHHLRNHSASTDSTASTSYKHQSIESNSTSTAVASSGTSLASLKKYDLTEAQTLREALESPDQDLRETLQLTPTTSAQSPLSDSSYPTPRQFVLRSQNPVDASNIRKPSISSPGDNKRKAPPQPLNLAQSPISVTSATSAGRMDEPESELDEEDEGDEDDIYAGIPTFERGRQRTRADDDRQREAIALIEERSRSKKAQKSTSNSKGKSKSAATDAAKPPPAPPAHSQDIVAAPEAAAAASSEAPAGLNASVGLPSSPRAPLLGGLQSPLQQSVGSISAMLHARLHHQTSSSAPKQSEVAALPLKSPGLPMSPRPGDRPMNPPTPRLPKHTIASPGPLSPRPTGANGMPLSPRAPRQPIPLPSNHPMFGVNSPHLARTDAASLQVSTVSASLAERLQPRSALGSSHEDEPEIAPHEGQVHRGLVSEQYPKLLLPPNALPVIYINVHSSRLRPSRHANLSEKTTDDDLVITLAVHGRSDRTQLWRVEKKLATMQLLDQALKTASDFASKLPEKSLFSGHAPAKMDARRTALNQYFEVMLDTPMSESAGLVICEFFSTDVIGPHVENTSATTTPVEPSAIKLLGRSTPLVRRRKEGYLAKRGKQFGGWKARYFVLEGTELQYYESPGGTHLGKIRMQNAQIARQVGHATAEDQGEYRHAFIIFEPKRRDASSLVRHVLCAESDEERDAWIEALMPYVEADDAIDAALSALPPHHHHGRTESPITADDATATANTSSRTRPANAAVDPQQKYITKPVQAPGYEDSHSVGLQQAQAAAAPSPSSPRLNREESWPSDEERPEALATQVKGHPGAAAAASSSSSPSPPSSGMVISGPIAGGPIQNLQAWGNRSPTMPKDAARDYSRKKSIFGFRSRGSDDSSSNYRPSSSKNGRNGSIPRTVPLRSRPTMPVFGMSLADAAELMPPVDVDICLPAPVYRCIEYLEAKDAAKEEGIFRLSGSSVVVKLLRDKFNSEGDFLLLNATENYDVHAVASLLKLYLRELPESILTRSLHLDMFKVLAIDDKPDKLAAINVLIHRLPEANYELLATLSRYLIDVVSKADYNKMNVRNVGIVFSPTLNIPPPLISHLITDHEAIFNDSVDPTSSPIIQNLDSSSSPTSPESTATTPTGAGIPDLRSPRKQMFSDLPTPAYHQTAFQQPFATSSSNGAGAGAGGSLASALQDRRDPQQYNNHSSSRSSPSQNSRSSSSNRVEQQPQQQQQQPSITPFYRYHNPLMTQVPDQGGFSSLNAVLAPPSSQPQLAPPFASTNSSSTSPSLTTVASASTSASAATSAAAAAGGTGTGTGAATTTAASSSSSSMMMRGRDSPEAASASSSKSSINNNVNNTNSSSKPTTAIASNSLNISGGSSSSQQQQTLDGRRKSSYQRLREMAASVKD